MASKKTQYVCRECGGISPKWQGQCPECGEWNTLEETAITNPSKSGGHSRAMGYAGAASGELIPLQSVTGADTLREKTGLDELDRALGGGVVPGSAVLIGGDPGIGKSTLLLQMCAALSQRKRVLYVSGEESLQQIKARAERLELGGVEITLMAETEINQILGAAQQYKPDILVVDSIQTTFTATLQSAPGSVAQVRESSAALVAYAKHHQTACFLVGHVTKEGALAGPRVLEHMVDTVLYFEGQSQHRYRLVRAIKNRFGAVNELGIFAMTERGLINVSHPSAIFLSRPPEPVPGSMAMASWEGTRPFLVEVQALVDETQLSNPKRVGVGIDQTRLAMLLAVLHRHGGLFLHGHDVFVNAVGGARIQETGADLAIIAALVSSFKNKPLPKECVVFGEIGLGGELRPVPGGQERLMEAIKHGFKVAIIPKANQPKKAMDCQIYAVSTLGELLQTLKGLMEEGAVVEPA